MKQERKGFKVLKCTHVTTTERKHLRAFLDSGHTRAKVNRKTYTIVKGSQVGSGMEYDITIETPYINDWGQSKIDRQTITVFSER